MQHPSMSLNNNKLTFNWEHEGNPITFSVDKGHFIQLVCKACRKPLPLVLDNAKYDCDCGRTITSDGLNHREEDYGRWVSYLGTWRCKDNYQILLKDGRIVDYCYPNGESWFVQTPNHQEDVTEHQFKDQDVLAIRLMPDNELRSKYEYRGKPRLDRNIDYFGDSFPTKERVIDLNGQYGILV